MKAVIVINTKYQPLFEKISIDLIVLLILFFFSLAYPFAYLFSFSMQKNYVFNIIQRGDSCINKFYSLDYCETKKLCSLWITRIACPLLLTKNCKKIIIMTNPIIFWIALC